MITFIVVSLLVLVIVLSAFFPVIRGHVERAVRYIVSFAARAVIGVLGLVVLLLPLVVGRLIFLALKGLSSWAEPLFNRGVRGSYEGICSAQRKLDAKLKSRA